MHTEPRASRQRLGLWQAWLSLRPPLHIRWAVWMREGRWVRVWCSAKEVAHFVRMCVYKVSKVCDFNPCFMSSSLDLHSKAKQSCPGGTDWPSSAEILPGKDRIMRKMRTNERQKSEQTRPPHNVPKAWLHDSRVRSSYCNCMLAESLFLCCYAGKCLMKTSNFSF